MGIYAVDTELEFEWMIPPDVDPPAKADYDIMLELPDGTVTYTDDGLLTHTAPTETTQGNATYKFTPTTAGRHRIGLMIGGSEAFTVKAVREIFVVDPPTHVISGISGNPLHGPEILPTEAPLVLDITTIFEPNPLKRVYIETQNNNPSGAMVSSDGMHVYTSRHSVEYIWQWDLSVAWDLSTAVYSQNIVYDGVGGSPGFDMWTWKPDGTKVWITNGGIIYAYSLSSAWDISTLTIDNASYNMDNDQSNNGSKGSGGAGYFKDDGTELYVLWLGNPIGDAVIGTWSLSTPWDITTLSFVGNTADIFNDEGFSPTSGYMTNDGKSWIVTDFTAQDFKQYNLATPYDHSTMDYAGKVFDYVTNLPGLTGTFPTSYVLSPDQKNLYIVDGSRSDY